jgi:hypothetical protein
VKHEDRDAVAKSTYSKLAKKYKLPELSIVQKEFSIHTDQLDAEDGMLLPSINESISKFLEGIIEDMEYILFGNDKYLPRLSKEDRTRLFNSYKKMQAALWEGKTALLEGDESMADRIKKVLLSWQKELKEETLWYSKKVQESWTESRASESEIRYVG